MRIIWNRLGSLNNFRCLNFYSSCRFSHSGLLCSECPPGSWIQWIVTVIYGTEHRALDSAKSNSQVTFG